MKTTIHILTIASMAALVGFGLEPSPSSAAKASTSRKPAGFERDDALTGRMRHQQDLILRRIGISAPLDAAETTDPATGIDDIQRLADAGFIIPATAEEVETALRAAALTEDPADDQPALILKHRGSYRFFLNE